MIGVHQKLRCEGWPADGDVAGLGRRQQGRAPLQLHPCCGIAAWAACRLPAVPRLMPPLDCLPRLQALCQRGRPSGACCRRHSRQGAGEEPCSVDSTASSGCPPSCWCSSLLLLPAPPLARPPCPARLPRLPPQQISVLCLDELFVTDVADAMILHRLFGRWGAPGGTAQRPPWASAAPSVVLRCMAAVASSCCARCSPHVSLSLSTRHSPLHLPTPVHTHSAPLHVTHMLPGAGCGIAAWCWWPPPTATQTRCTRAACNAPSSCPSYSGSRCAQAGGGVRVCVGWWCVSVCVCSGGGQGAKCSCCQLPDSSSWPSLLCSAPGGLPSTFHRTAVPALLYRYRGRRRALCTT